MAGSQAATPPGLASTRSHLESSPPSRRLPRRRPALLAPAALADTATCACARASRRRSRSATGRSSPARASSGPAPATSARFERRRRHASGGGRQCHAGSRCGPTGKARTAATRQPRGAHKTAAPTCCSMVSTRGGSRPRRPSRSRSTSGCAVPLLKTGAAEGREGGAGRVGRRRQTCKPPLPLSSAAASLPAPIAPHPGRAARRRRASAPPRCRACLCSRKGRRRHRRRPCCEVKGAGSGGKSRMA